MEAHFPARMTKERMGASGSGLRRGFGDGFEVGESFLEFAAQHLVAIHDEAEGFADEVVFAGHAPGDDGLMVFGGEGLFLATLRGTGRVWIQSMPVKKLIQALMPNGGNASKEGGLLSSFLE